MAVDALATWEDTWENLPLDAVGAFPATVTNWLDARVVNFTFNPASLGGPVSAFTWAKATFQAGITNMIPELDQNIGVTILANAWRDAINASTINALVGSFLPPDTPATRFSVVSSTTIDAASVTAARSALIAALLAAQPNLGFPFPVPTELRTAFLSVTYTATGLHSLVIPVSLTVPGIAVL